MKLIAILFLTHVLFSATVPPEIENSTLFEINKLPARTFVWPGPNATAVQNSSYESSVWTQSLNGEWSFSWSKDPQSRIANFYETSYSVASWDKITVPSTMERAGYGTALYSNIAYPFHTDPPRVMGAPSNSYTSYNERNPVGSYRRNFTIPDDWKDKRIILHIAGSASATYVWVNGKSVGYSQDSRLPAEFDITSNIVSGNNILAIEVYKFCDGSYLEDQDMWRLSGLFRDVLLTCVPVQALWDIFVQPNVNLTSRQGTVTVHYTPANFADAAVRGFSLRLSVTSPSGGGSEKAEIASEQFALSVFAAGFGTLEIALPEVAVGVVELWYVDRVVQYTAVVELVDAAGAVVEAFKIPVAFKKLTASGKVMYLNGETFKIRGVNRHEFTPALGYTTPKESMIQDIKLMKQANINFVRTCHYPNNPLWYEVCSEYGMMILDEANVESHGLRDQLPAGKAEWKNAVVDRARRMTLRDRQWPCVFFWSLGNEAGSGSNFNAMRDAIKAADPEGRLVQYEGMNSAGDLDSTMYSTAASLRSRLSSGTRPFFMVEYAHAMGNSGGDLIDYWDLFNDAGSDMLTGAFIWDWVDQGLYRDNSNQKAEFLYGGDFKDQPNDDNFCINGIIAPNRVPHPHYYEVKKVYQPAHFTLVSHTATQAVFSIKNRHTILNLNTFDFEYTVTEDGVETGRGTIPAPDVAYQQTKNVTLAGIAYNASKEAFLNVYMKLKANTLWANKGHVVAYEQFALTNVTVAAPADAECGTGGGSTTALTVTEGTSAITVTGGDFTATVSVASGLLSSYTYKGVQLIKESSTSGFNFWRAPTDNDEGWNIASKMAAAKNDSGKSASQRNSSSHTTPGTNSQCATFTSTHSFSSTRATANVTQKFFRDGRVLVDVAFTTNSDVPRLGLSYQVDKALSTVEWYGRGPQENYRDRKTGATVGTYKLTLDEFITPYLRAQENANREEVRWFRVANGSVGLRFTAVGANRFSASAWPYTQATLESTKHNYELKADANNVVNIDAAQMGVGGDDSWGATPLDKYYLHSGKYSYQFVIQGTAAE